MTSPIPSSIIRPIRAMSLVFEAFGAVSVELQWLDLRGTRVTDRHVLASTRVRPRAIVHFPSGPVHVDGPVTIAGHVDNGIRADLVVLTAFAELAGVIATRDPIPGESNG